MALTRKLNRLFVKLATKAIRARDFALHRDPVDAVLAEVRSAGPEPELEVEGVVGVRVGGGVPEKVAAPGPAGEAEEEPGTPAETGRGGPGPVDGAGGASGT